MSIDVSLNDPTLMTESHTIHKQQETDSSISNLTSERMISKLSTA